VKILDNEHWVRETFQDCDFGDRRRNERLLMVANGMVDAPDKSLPCQFPEWADLKAAYRFFDTAQVTLDAICTPHWEQSRNTKPGRYLLISDTTDLNFTWHQATTGLGMLGDGKGRGIQLHSCLMYSLDEKQVVGVAGAVTHYRSFMPKNETRTQRLARSRESEIWGNVVDQVGTAPKGSQWIHVFDRGGDNFEAMSHIKLSENDWVIRASKLNRKVTNSRGEQLTLSQAIEEAIEIGTFSMELRSTPRHAARTASLTIYSCEVTFPGPSNRSPWLKQCKIKELTMNVVIAKETNPPKGNNPICWVILTSLPIACFKDAWKALEYYEHRWMIEEYNRVAKSGCSIEGHALRTAERIEAIVGLTSIIAARLFQMKLIGRNQPKAKAATHVPSTWLNGLKLLRPKIKITTMTVYDFFRQLAMLGGFLGRKHDGEPGWQTIWRGYQKLHQTIIGMELAQRNL
jgi:hypothetical protein